MMRGYLMVIALGACSGSSAKPPDDGQESCTTTPVAPLWKSGSQLRARVARPEACGSTPERMGWHDTAFGWDCSFQVSGDGTLRCLPEALSSEYVVRYYTTSDCSGTELAGGLGPSSCGGYGFLIQGFGNGMTGNTLVQLGMTSVATSSIVARRIYDGTCLADAQMYLPDWACPTSIVTNLVSASEVRMDVGPGGLQARVLHGSDDSIEPIGIVDSVNDVPFSWVREVDSSCHQVEHAFVPFGPHVSTLTWFGDAGCTQRAGCIQSGTAVAYMNQVAPSGPMCDALGVVTTYAVGAATTNIYVGAPNSCAPMSSFGSDCYLAGSQLAAIPTTSADLGTGRLRPRWVAVGGVPVLPASFTPTFFDEQLGIECAPKSTTDPSATCVPTSGPEDPGAAYATIDLGIE